MRIDLNTRARSASARIRPNRSPHESAHVVRPAHHQAGYALVEGKLRGARCVGGARNRQEAQHEGQARSAGRSGRAGTLRRLAGQVEYAVWRGKEGSRQGLGAPPMKLSHNALNKRKAAPDPGDPGRPVFYQIRIMGHLGPDWADWFGDLPIRPADQGETLGTGPVIDRAALHGLLR